MTQEFKVGDIVSPIKHMSAFTGDLTPQDSFVVKAVGFMKYYQTDKVEQYISVFIDGSKYSQWDQWSKYFRLSFNPDSVEIEDFL